MLYSAAPLSVVSLSDPALDMNIQEMAAYAESRDPSLIKVKPGELATVFTIRRIPQSKLLNFMQTATSDDRRHVLSFMVAVTEVRNLRLESATLDMWRPNWMTASKEGEHMKDDELDNFALDEILDIGSVAYQRAFLRPGRTACYEPPALSVFALAKKIRSSRLVDTQDHPSQKSTEPKEPPAKSESSDGDEDGDVIAPGLLNLPGPKTMKSKVQRSP